MLLKVRDLKKKFGNHQVLNGLNLDLDSNQIIGLLGPNGSGKSTLIKCVNDLFTPDEGTIEIDGKASSPQSRMAISYLPDASPLSPRWKVKKALKFYETFYPDFDAAKASKMLRQLDLDENQEIQAMSKGMQEKLQLVLVMSRKAKLYILDEPLGGIDPASRDVVLDTILTNFEEGSSLLISTHLISDVERILDRAVFMEDGEIILDENAEELRERTGHSLNQEFRDIYRSQSKEVRR